MFHFLKEVRILRQEGKLHRKLIIRIRILLFISLILAGIVVFNVIYRDANWFAALALMIGGFLIGLFVFSRMNVIQWNEEQEVVEAGRMDMIGYAMIALYVAFEIGLRTVLIDFYPVSATAFILAAVCGTLLGRSFGTIIEIHRVFKATHSQSAS